MGKVLPAGVIRMIPVKTMLEMMRGRIDSRRALYVNRMTQKAFEGLCEWDEEWLIAMRDYRWP